jgi:DNA-binding transcriptional regulator YiaG
MPLNFSQTHLGKSLLMTPDELRAFRQHYNLTQAALADHLNKKKGTIRDWEAGRRPINRDNECAIEQLVNKLCIEGK